MGACLTKIKDNEKQSNTELFQEINTALEKIQTILNKVLANNDLVIENQFSYMCKKNEESTLSNRDQIDYLLQNCVEFGKRLKELENKSSNKI